MRMQGLSALQRAILVCLFEDYVDLATPPTTKHWLSQLTHWGARLRLVADHETRATQAARSRALARLEARGLILRQNEVSGSPTRAMARRSAAEAPPLRTTHVLLLPAGIEVAERLTQKVGVWKLTVGDIPPWPLPPLTEDEYRAECAKFEAEFRTLSATGHLVQTPGHTESRP